MRYPNVRPPLCGISRASTSNPSTRWTPSSIESNVQSPRSRSGPIGNAGGPMNRRDQIDRRHALLRNEQTGHRVGTITGTEERQPVGVVPVQVTEQDRASERLARQQRRDRSQPGAGVEHETRHLLVVVGDRDARRVPADAGEVHPDRRSRPAHPTQVDPHRLDDPPRCGTQQLVGIRACTEILRPTATPTLDAPARQRAAAEGRGTRRSANTPRSRPTGAGRCLLPARRPRSLPRNLRRSTPRPRPGRHPADPRPASGNSWFDGSNGRRW